MGVPTARRHRPLQTLSDVSADRSRTTHSRGKGQPSARARARTLMILRLRAAATLTTDAPWATRAFNRSSSSCVQTQGWFLRRCSKSLISPPSARVSTSVSETTGPNVPFGKLRFRFANRSPCVMFPHRAGIFQHSYILNPGGRRIIPPCGLFIAPISGAKPTHLFCDACVVNKALTLL